MKSFLIFLALAFTSDSLLKASTPADSIIVQFGNKSKIVIYTENKADFQKIRNYDVNALLRDLGVKIDSISPNETRLVVTEADGRLYLKDSISRHGSGNDDKTYVRIGIRGIHVKDGSDEVHVDWSGVHVKSGNEEVNIGSSDTLRWNRRSANRWVNSHTGLYFNLGLNNYVGTGSSNPASNSDFDLKPFGSRYFALGWLRNARLGRGKNAAFNLGLGLEVSWNNFMFDGNNVARRDDPLPGRVNFPEAADNLSKSKLTVAYLNAPIMPTVVFRNSAIRYLALGGSVGYRLDSYTKIKRADGSKDHQHGGFYLNNFRYGLRAEVGIRNFLDFFVNYDLNPLYTIGRGPELRTVSFGIRL